MDEISKNRNEAKDRELEKQRAINQHTKIERSMEGCEHCLDSKNMLKHLMVSCGSKVYVALPAKQSLVSGQCIITTIQHATCVTALDEDVWEEILVSFKSSLLSVENHWPYWPPQSITKLLLVNDTASGLHPAGACDRYQFIYSFLQYSNN